MFIQHNTTAAAAPNAHRILIIGGAYAGITALVKLLKFGDGDPDSTLGQPKRPLHITLLDSRDGFYHTVGSPLVFASSPFVVKAWRRFSGIKVLQRPDVQLVWGKAKRIDTASKTAIYTKGESTIEEAIQYDYLITASGVNRLWPVVPRASSKDEYEKEVGEFISEVKSAKHAIVVVGGGAVGIEVAAELAVLYPTQHIVLIHSRQELLSSELLPTEFKSTSLRLLQESGVEVIFGQRVNGKSTRETKDGYLISLEGGRELKASKIINAVSGSVPSTEFLPKEVLNEDNYVKVLPTLQFPPTVPNSSSHFCIGDPAHVSGIKRAGAAMAMGIQAATNITTLILSSEEAASVAAPQKLLEWPEVPPMIALAIGKVAASYSPEQGVNFGEDIMRGAFGDDLGWTICWDYMGLGRTDDEREF